MFTRLCLPDGPPPATVQLLVHGVTYTHLYWDFPDPTGGTPRYSYVKAALDAGFATLALDRIGSGASSHPLGALDAPQWFAVAQEWSTRLVGAGPGPAPGCAP